MKKYFFFIQYPKGTALLVGCAFGLSGCFNTPWIFGLWFFLPIVWLAFSNRWQASLFISAFYLSVAWEIIPDTLNYVGWDAPAVFLGLGIWLAAGFFPTIPWTICFPTNKQQPSSLLFSLLSLFFLLTIPPFGVIIWGNPLTSAGLIYPGFRLWGLGLCTLLIISVSFAIYLRRYRFMSIVIVGFLLFMAVYAQRTFPSLPQPPSNWVAVNTSSRFVDFNSYLTETVRAALHQGKKVIILPENVVNLYDVRHDPLWKKLITELAQAHATLITGAYAAATLTSSNTALIFYQKHQEGVLIIAQNQFNFYPTRAPLPFLSWQPIGKSHVAAHWWRSGVYGVQGERVGTFICFEGFLPWMMITTALDAPNILILIANHWWNMPTAIHKQLWIFQLWARLLNTPVLISENLQ